MDTMSKKVFVALFAATFAAQLGMGIIAPLMHLFSERTGASGLWLGIMFSGYAMSQLIFMPVVGRLSDVGGRKKFIALGLVAYTVISLFYALTPNIYALTFIRLIHGLASCMVAPIAQAYIGDLIPEGKEGTYINLFAMSVFLGMGFGPFLGGVLTYAFYMNAAFYAMAGLSALALFLLLPFVPSIESSSKVDDNAQRAPLRTIIRDNKVKGLFMYRASRGFWRQGIIAFLPFLVIPYMNMSEADIGLLLSVYLITDGIVQGFTGPLVDRFSKTALLIICSFIGPALIFLIPYMHSGKTLLAVLLLVALPGGIGRGTGLAVNVELGRQYQAMGTLMGTFHSAMSIGMIAGPITFGYVMDHFGISSVFGTGAIVGLIGAFMTAYFLLRK
jgi:MFS family permease